MASQVSCNDQDRHTAVIQYITPTQPTQAEGGIVYHRNGGQIVMRTRAYPVLSVRQAHRPGLQAIVTLSIRWELLTNAQRAAWGNYGFMSPVTDAWNNPRQIRGYAHYMRSNRTRLIFGLDPIDDGPIDAGFPDFTTPTFSISPDASTITITPTSSDDWANEDNAYLFAFVSPPHRPAARTPPERWQPLGAFAGAAFSPPGPADFANPWQTAGPDADLWLRYAVSRADGRYTSSAAS